MLRGSPALGRSHASFAAEHGGEIIAVGEPAFEGDLADGKSGMQLEQDLGFRSAFPLAGTRCRLDRNGRRLGIHGSGIPQHAQGEGWTIKNASS